MNPKSPAIKAARGIFVAKRYESTNFPIAEHADWKQSHDAKRFLRHEKNQQTPQDSCVTHEAMWSHYSGQTEAIHECFAAAKT